MGANKNEFIISKPNLEDAIHIWNRASITLLDIRHNLISPQDSLRRYRLPSSAFIYTGGASAEVLLNDTSYQIDRFSLIHGGKGTELSITPTNNWLEYYMVLYKAGEPAFHKNEFSKLLEKTNPFRQQFGFTPSNPIYFANQLRKMYERWKAPAPLNLFYGKTAFYQFIYEIYEELEKGDISILEPDIISMAIQYLDSNFNKTITIQELCDLLGISYSHFHRNFKKQTGYSPQEYLIKKRLKEAMKWLRDSNTTIREIATYCGFPDEYNFHRIFVKNTQMTPGAYREKSSALMRDNIIENVIPFSYNKKSQVSPSKLEEEGVHFMLKQIRTKAIASVALSLMLLLTACGSTPVNTNSTETTPTQAVTTEAQNSSVTEAAKGETKTVTTIMGDVDVPVNPERIAVWVYEQELYSLGVTPVAISDTNYHSVWPGLPSLNYAPDKEELLSLEPDLLITYDDGNFFNEYKDIAPVVTIPLATSAEETLRFLGDLLNLSDKAEQLIEEFNTKAADSRDQLEQAGIKGKTVVLVEPIGDTLWIYDNSYGRGGSILYDYMDFEIPAAVKEEMGDKHYINISYELLSQYCNADYIVAVSGEGYESLKTNEVWNALPAVQANHVYEFNTEELNGRGLDSKTLEYYTNCFVGQTTN
jgi:iron complex transport system substrate-binding protein